MYFKENPFFLLKLHSRTDSGSIAEAVEDRIFDAEDEEAEAKLRNMEELLTNPRRRLSAEMFWLCGVSSETAYTLLQRDLHSDIGFFNKIDGLSLPAWNKFLLLLNGARNPDYFSEWVLRLDAYYAQMQAPEIMAVINADRKIAQVPSVLDVSTINEGLRAVSAFGVKAAKAAAERMNSENYEQQIQRIVSDDADGLIKRELLEDYRIKKNGMIERLQEEADVLYTESESETESDSECVSHAMELLTRVNNAVAIITRYDIKKRFTVDSSVDALLNTVRNIAIDFNNKKADYDTALVITQRMLGYFDFIPEWKERLEDDIKTLLEIKARGDFVKKTKLTAGGNSGKGKSQSRPVPKANKEENKANGGGRSCGCLAVSFVILMMVLFFNFLGTNPSGKKAAESAKNVGATQTVEKKEDAKQPGDYEYRKPPIGTQCILSVPEIRWVLRERIRIETMQAMDLNEEGIDAVNQMVDDFNQCGASFRYKRNHLESAKEDVESVRGSIVEEARAEVIDNQWLNSY